MEFYAKKKIENVHITIMMAKRKIMIEGLKILLITSR
jgi:hypothetical protein